MKHLRWQFKALALVMGVSGILVGQATGGQSLNAERHRVLTSQGHSKPVQLNLFPLRPETGLVFKQEISEPTAKSLALHFQIAKPGADWRIQLRQRGTVRWEISEDEVQDPDFWSEDIPGTQLTIEVYSSSRNNGVELTVDKIAIGTEKRDPVSVKGANDMKPIAGQDEWIVAMGRSVARLRFVGDDGLMYFCTAFLISPQLMMTNQHCIATESERKSAKVDFDFDMDNSKPHTVRLSALVESDEALDYSVVRLAEASDRPPLALTGERPAAGAQLLIVEHPEGIPKKVSIKDCIVSATEAIGRRGGKTDFGHDCDTLGGSSGSPVILFTNRKVLGLHHLGFDSMSDDPFNRAVHMDLVLADLSAATRRELGLDN